MTAAYVFDWKEYSSFFLMLLLSTAIGIYFGCVKGGQNSVAEYLLGSRSMGTIPIAISLVASYISGVTLLGVPTEIYTYGTQFFIANVANVLVSIFTGVVFLPVFFKLQLISLYEYLEMRFSKSVRIIASFLNALSLITFIPIVVYGPALAFNQVSGINVHLMTPLLCLICVFYTTLGGLKAVVWTDTIQAVIMLCSTITVAVLGLIRTGGFSEVWKAVERGDRVEFFNMNPDPTERLTFWSGTLGLMFTWTAQLAVNPGVTQRFNALATYKQAQWSLVILTFGVCTFAVLSMAIGLLMYATYEHCDPLSAKLISRADQILPHYVLDVAGNVKGLPGLFLAGIVSAALSTMSTALNTIAGTIFEDFVLPCIPGKASEETSSRIMKGIVVLTGVSCILMVLVIENLGHILEMASSFGGVTTGSALGIFMLGVLFPWANTKGALTGGLVSLSVMTWMLAGNEYYTSIGLIKYPTKPLRVDGCSFNVSTPLNITSVAGGDYVLPLYRISVFHYGLIGCLLVLIVGLPVSFLTGANDPRDVDPRLLSPYIRRFIRKRRGEVALPLQKVVA